MGVISRAALATHKWAIMKTITILIVMAFAITGSLAFPLATQEDVEKEIANVADTEETDFAKEERDAKAIIEESIDAVRDLEETEFAAEPRDAEAALLEFIGNVRDLQPTDFSKVFDEKK